MLYDSAEMHGLVPPVPRVAGRISTVPSRHDANQTPVTFDLFITFKIKHQRSAAHLDSVRIPQPFEILALRWSRERFAGNFHFFNFDASSWNLAQSSFVQFSTLVIPSTANSCASLSGNPLALASLKSRFKLKLKMLLSDGSFMSPPIQRLAPRAPERAS